MANFERMILTVQSACGGHSLLTKDKVAEFLNGRHEELIESYDWSRKKQEIIIITAIDKTAGTVAVVSGSPSVVGAGTAFAASDVGRYIGFAALSDLYIIKAVVGQTLTLGDLNGTTVNYAGLSDAASSYVLFTRYYNLTAGVERLISAKHIADIRPIDMERIDDTDPSRLSSSNEPEYCALGPRSMVGNTDIVRVEFWPRPTASIAIRVNVLLGHTDLSGKKNPLVPSNVLEWSAAMMAAIFLHAKTGDERWIAQHDKFKDHFDEALEQELATDMRKSGLSRQVKDVEGGEGISDDFRLSHDV